MVCRYAVYNDYIELRERVLMSKKLDKVGLEPTTFGFPCLRVVGSSPTWSNFFDIKTLSRSSIYIFEGRISVRN